MSDSEKKEVEKKEYVKPAIVHEEVLDAIAGACSSTFDGISTCRYAACDLPEN
jgi:hypothetical protein